MITNSDCIEPMGGRGHRMTLRYRVTGSAASHGRGLFSNAAFSLIELLVVIAIVALLMAILLPSIGRAKHQARLVLCKGNLRQWGFAVYQYRADFKDYLPTEGSSVPTVAAINDKKAWYNLLPPYLGMMKYKDIEGAGIDIRELPGNHFWVCPAKNISHLNTSESGKNQFHYAMNRVLDGTGGSDGSSITPGFPDAVGRHSRATEFESKPYTVMMMDILPNSPNGDPASVGDTFTGHGTLHFKAANVLYVNGGVASFKDEDYVKEARFRDPVRIWNHPQLYWGYLPQGN
jgi:prepilin-type N-terminal cleavage/methylation domain-containing protein